MPDEESILWNRQIVAKRVGTDPRKRLPSLWSICPFNWVIVRVSNPDFAPQDFIYTARPDPRAIEKGHELWTRLQVNVAVE